MIPITQTFTTLITGFLGAGKTTLLNTLLQHKPTSDTWAILVNEFGHIGIDGSLIDTKGDITIKEVSGGCICCSSQLPMQVAMVRLLTLKPNRLIIEPTGLADGTVLVDELSANHWQTSLRLCNVICVLNAKQYQQIRCREHDGYQSHVKAADVVVISLDDELSADEQSAMRQWIHTINPHVLIMTYTQLTAQLVSDVLFAIKQPKTTPHRIISLAPPPTLPLTDPQEDIAQHPTLPHRYHEKMGAYAVGGWQLPSQWTFDEYGLQRWLLALPEHQRIKGIVHTTGGWLVLNITPQNTSITPTHQHQSTKIELILRHNHNLDEYLWQRFDDELMALVV